MSLDDDDDLVGALLTRVGVTMEDASVIALSSSSGDYGVRLTRLSEAVHSMAALLRAAEAIRDR